MAIAVSLSSGCDDSPKSSPVPGCQTHSDCEDYQVCIAELCVDRQVTTSGRPSTSTSDAGGLTPPLGGFPDASCFAFGCDAGAQRADAGLDNGALSLQRLPFVAQDLVGDPARKRVYATVAGAATRYANQLVTLDAKTGEVLAGVHVGSDPASLALAHDGTSLWVSLTGAQAVRRVDLTTAMPTPAEQHTLPSDASGERKVPGQILTLPDQPRSIVVSQLRPSISPGFGGLLVLDDGVVRPQTDTGYARGSRFAAGEPGYLFGYNNQSTGHEFEVVAIGAAGLTYTQHKGLMSSFANDIVYADKRIFARGGEVIDVSMPDAPKRSGKFGVSGSIVEPVDATTPVMLSRGAGGTGPALQVHVLDSATFTIKRSIEIRGVNGYEDIGVAVQGDPAIVFFVTGSYYPGAATFLLKTNDGRPFPAQ